jgi:hypothetical protein
LLLESHTGCDKYLYLWDYNPLARFDATQKLLKDKRLKIAVRSEGHKAMLENNYNVKVDAIIEDWDINQLEKFLGEDDEQN